jgi:SAM-dependent methyltransferase
MVSATLVTKMIGLLVWGRADDGDPMAQVLSLLPDSFHGVLLDVPVGTGVFTASLYRRHPDATIVGVDCSWNMLRRAQACFQEHDVRNVHLLKADVAALPIRDAGADIVLSRNGWHAFADKPAAIAEMKRVLAPGGKLIACGYVQGARRRSDGFVRHFGVRHGYFTPPFFTRDDLARHFEGFTMARQGSDESIAWFEAAKQRVRMTANPPSAYEVESLRRCRLRPYGYGRRGRRVALCRCYPDGLQPCLHQRRPPRDRKFCTTQSKPVFALPIQMHLHGNPSLLQRHEVHQRVLYRVHGVIRRRETRLPRLRCCSFPSARKPSSSAATHY